MAQLLHEATVGTRFVQDDVDGWKQTARVGSSLATIGSGPPVTRDVGAIAHDVIDLKNPPADLPGRNFFDVLIERRTRRSFSPLKCVTEQELSTLLHFSARAHGSLRNPFFGDHILRTSPSGGARHPVEIYPQTLRVDGIPEGNYHYDPVMHRLQRLGNTSNELLCQLGQKQSGCSEMPLAFIITARFSRNLWKYRYAKSFLFTYLDVGHFVQTLILCCQAVGLKTFLTPALDVTVAQKHLHLEEIYDECATYLVCAG
ncbi:SagB/ThcOx family dehydrogenase [Streptomyces iakyrus]|uniref:SagB/ThcOx family dehydrogenase n=1 Tax=Streptomyces iakyrus TaxID=68219 RepID=UPI0036F0A067